jgi:hypothetical protein
LVFKRKEVKEE